MQCANLQTLVSLLSRELQRDVKTLRKVVEQMSTQMDSQAVRERPKIAALLEEVNVIITGVRWHMELSQQSGNCRFCQ